MFYFIFVGFCSWVNQVRFPNSDWHVKQKGACGSLGAGTYRVLDLTSLLQCAHTRHPASLGHFISAPFCPVWIWAILGFPILRQVRASHTGGKTTTVASCTCGRSLVATHPANEQMVSSSPGTSPLPCHMDVRCLPLKDCVIGSNYRKIRSNI